ncbi:hypothetical protein FACS1894217_08100 [Clostridia bacterium]|nr:hypothetical protein FACS1894217_08100 [Clostridia bacterium]
MNVKLKPLSELCNLNMGQSPSSDSYNQDGEGIPFYQGNADFGELHPTVRYWCSQPTKIANDGDILISVRAPIGALNIATEKCCIGRGLAALTAKEEVSDTHYLLYALRSRVDELNANGTGSTFKAIIKSVLGNTLIPAPDFSDQCVIAERLDKTSELVALRRQQLADLDTLVKSRFVEMFGEPETNPMGWDVNELQNVGNVGSSRRVFASEFTETGVPFFRGTEITLLSKGGFTVPKYYIAEKHYEELKAMTGVPKVGDLLLPSICAEGEVWMVDIETPFYIKDGRVLWVQIGDKVNGLYLRYALKDQLTANYQQVASGTTFAEMKIFALKKVKVLVPPLPRQEKFADFVRQVDKSKFEIQQGLEKLELQYNALMQRYFG